MCNMLILQEKLEICCFKKVSIQKHKRKFSHSLQGWADLVAREKTSLKVRIAAAGISCIVCAVDFMMKSLQRNKTSWSL